MSQNQTWIIAASGYGGPVLPCRRHPSRKRLIRCFEIPVRKLIRPSLRPRGVVGVCLVLQTAQWGRDVERQIAHQRGVHSYAQLLHRNNSISEVDWRRGAATLLSRADCTLQGPRRTGWQERLEKPPSWPVAKIAVQDHCRFPECASKRKGRLSSGADDAELRLWGLAGWPLRCQ